ncbi:MAG: glycerol kinase GlpK [Lachnospiraceae bacterium]|nr:glycerol kinase GlpK [Lachnospiraceae bacterium]
MSRYVLAFDAGTTSERAILFDHEGKIVSLAQKEIRQYYPQPGWVEHDPMELWSTQLGVAVEAMSKAGVSAEDIASIGITNQRETTIVWDKESGLPVYNAIVWQCRRTTALCEELAPQKEKIREKTGLVLDPYFSATKLKWILENVEGAKERAEKGELLFGTVESWLIWKLTKGRVHVTDYSNASRTMLYNIRELKWDEEICEMLGIPPVMLPQVVSNSEVYGETDPAYLGGAIKIAGAAGDQQAALFGQKCFKAGEIKNTYGTGCFLLMNTGEQAIASKSGLVSTIAWGLDGRVTYALEGSVFMGGALIQWLRDELGLLGSAAESEELAQKVPDTEGCYIVPAFTGLGAPYWKPEAKGMIMGLTRGVGRYHIIRAALDAIAYQVNDIVEAMARDAGSDLTVLKVDGGASSNAYLCRAQADYSHVQVQRPECVETTALGAAFLAGLATGFWKDLSEIEKCGGGGVHFDPSMDSALRDARIKGWKEAVAMLG